MTESIFNKIHTVRLNIDVLMSCRWSRRLGCHKPRRDSSDVYLVRSYHLDMLLNWCLYDIRFICCDRQKYMNVNCCLHIEAGRYSIQPYRVKVVWSSLLISRYFIGCCVIHTHTHTDIQTHHACHPYRVSRTFVCDNVNISVIFFHLSAVNNECNKLLLTDSYLYYTGSSLLHTGLLLITLFLLGNISSGVKSLNTYVMMHPAEPDKQM